MYNKNYFLLRTIVWGLLVGLLLLTTNVSITQEQAQGSEFKFSFDLNRFRYAESLTNLEFTADLYRDVMKYIQDGERYRCEYIVTADLMQNDSLLFTKHWKNVDTISSLDEATETLRLCCKNYFVVGPGEYEFKIKIEDPNSGESAEYVSPVKIENFAPGKLKISDIQFASSIAGDASKGLFVKNGYRVIPNPSGVYGIGLPVLFSYAEVYNLAPPTRESGSKYRVTYKIFNENGEEVKTRGPKEKEKPDNSSVDVNRITVVTLVSGRYSFVMEVEDLENGEKTASQRQFFVYRESDFVEKSSEPEKKDTRDIYAEATEKELDQEFASIRYVSIKKERNIYKQSNLEGKRRFLKEFWEKRNPTPGSPENEFRQDYLKRVKFANEAYKGRFREGWETDRGRVLLIYGHPDEIDRNAFGSNKRTHEVWHYWDLEDHGAVEFIFVDKRYLGDLQLVHSTARGEIFDADWLRWLN